MGEKKVRIHNKDVLVQLGTLCDCRNHGKDAEPAFHASECSYYIWFKSEPREVVGDDIPLEGGDEQ